ncbi:hypothetical protein BDZ90DRAFT_260978 [Jaminaea rosea]|uniref:Stress-response A/B barrel domain-containing protein n=1 Tax=Jaminaea rosea TaxID=1569628 RepID=A0A316UN53_9BASI|nr:hypothetical protein BDZ90DRAFT_260978 [Jaminaea rosea]PWN26717.1 hypothetical protein BDZ90DRAFT_260978 [Jaminaea rosea]
MPYTHIVSFKYRSDVDAAKRQEAYDRFLQLKPSCETKEGKPYILDLKAGKGNVSPEGKGHGYDQIFIAIFANERDVAYYLGEDPVHLEYMDFVKPLLEDAFIFDFTDLEQK